MSQNRINNKLPQNLPQLQNLIKRDPISYREEFDRHFLNYEARKAAFQQNPSAPHEELYDLVLFLAQVSHCYTEKLSDFPTDLVKYLDDYGTVMVPNLRNGFVKALMTLRNKNLLAPTTLLQLFFKLLKCQDKALRKFLEEHIVNDIKNINSKSKNMKLNKELQKFMFEVLKDHNAVAAKTALNVMIQLYHKRIWNDTATVNFIASGCFSKITKLMVTAIKFFIGRDDEGGGNDDSDSNSDSDDDLNMRTTLMAARVSKKTRKKQKHVEKVKKTIKKNRKKEKNKCGFDFSAIHLIHDPQDMAERLYKRLEKMNERFEVKLMMMNLISRLVGIHQLYLNNFYPLVQKFLFPHQREVTKIMVYAAQAAHPLVPPDELEPVIRTLANNFVTERCSNEAMAMGINAIRELCSRNPYAMSEELIQDLAEYKTHKDKGVMMAARSLISLFREKNASILVKKDRGAPTEMSVEEKVSTEKFCRFEAKGYIPGAEVLTFITGDDVPEDSSDDSGSDDEDERPAKKMKKSNDQATSNISKESKNKDEKSGELEIKDDRSDEEDEEIDDEEKSGGEASEGEDEEEEEVESDEEEEDEDEDEKETDENSKPSQTMSRKEAIKEVLKLTPEERAKMATEVVTSRFLTDEDFARIEATQASKQVEKYSAGKKKSRSQKRRQLEQQKFGSTNEIVKENSIVMIYKKRKHDKDARMETVLSGREDREKFGQKRGRMNPHASTTNKEKKKTKSYMMLKHKFQKKKKVSFVDKQAKLRASLLKQQRTIMK